MNRSFLHLLVFSRFEKKEKFFAFASVFEIREEREVFAFASVFEIRERGEKKIVCHFFRFINYCDHSV